MTAVRAPLSRQHGLTLVEVMVAITLMLLITVATVALYGVNSASKRTVDASLQLDDTARFVFQLVGEAARNAGYANRVVLSGGIGAGGVALAPAGTVSPVFERCALSAQTVPCPVLGFDNSTVTTAAAHFGSANSVAPNHSDSLAIRFAGAGADARSGNARADGTMRTCNGTAVAASAAGVATTEADLGLSIFYVKADSGEPALFCMSDPGTGVRDSNALVRGVETFQVMYALDLCLPAGSAQCTRDGLPDRWVSAQQVAPADWRFVKALRVGLVLRGGPGSAQVASSELLYPLGKDFTTGLDEAGIAFKPPADGRLRRTYVTTFLLRNSA